MDRFGPLDITRLLGIALLSALVAWSFGYYQDAVQTIQEDQDGPARSLARSVQEEVDLTSADAEPPRYLALTVGFPSGAYRVADVPDSRDRDYTLRDRDAAEAAEALEELEPGLYGTSFTTEGCSFELRRVMRTRIEQVIGQDFLRDGRLLVDINGVEPDSFISASECGEWVPWSPVVEPLTTADNGDYWIGDLARGTWDVPEGCVWEKVAGFRGANLWDVEESAWGPGELVIDEDTLGVRLRNCQLPITLN